VMGDTRRGQRLVVKLLIRPVPPTGSGAGDRERTCGSSKDASPSGGQTPGRQPTANHRQTAKAILTDLPPSVSGRSGCSPDTSCS
jgi:hypothetical protein